MRTNLCAVLLIALTACTVTPRTVSDGGPSFDGAVRNSGFIGYDANGYGIITPNARERYNGLVLEYGNRYLPALVPDAGIQPTTTNTYLIDPEHLVDFMEMTTWRKTKPQ